MAELLRSTFRNPRFFAVIGKERACLGPPETRPDRDFGTANLEARATALRSRKPARRPLERWTQAGFPKRNEVAYSEL